MVTPRKFFRYLKQRPKSWDPILPLHYDRSPSQPFSPVVYVERPGTAGKPWGESNLFKINPKKGKAVLLIQICLFFIKMKIKEVRKSLQGAVGQK